MLTQALDNCRVKPLRQAIRAGMVGRCDPSLRSHTLRQLVYHLVDKLPPLIAQQLFWWSKSANKVKQMARNFFCTLRFDRVDNGEPRQVLCEDQDSHMAEGRLRKPKGNVQAHAIKQASHLQGVALVRNWLTLLVA